MGVYAVTGSASGMGAAVAAQLRAAGHEVIGIDQRDANIVADLSTPAGRQAAIDAVLTRCGGVLDGAVMAAGIAGAPGRDRPRLIGQVNVLGVTELLTAWRPALAAHGRARVVVFGSNSVTTTPMVPPAAVQAYRRGQIDRAARIFRPFGASAPPVAYAASKAAVTQWARATAVQPEWAGAGIRLNVLAPGAIRTPLLERLLESPRQAQAINGFLVPTGGFGGRGPARRVGSSCSATTPTSCAAVSFRRRRFGCLVPFAGLASPLPGGPDGHLLAPLPPPHPATGLTTG